MVSVNDWRTGDYKFLGLHMFPEISGASLRSDLELLKLTATKTIRGSQDQKHRGLNTRRGDNMNCYEHSSWSVDEFNLLCYTLSPWNILS